MICTDCKVYSNEGGDSERTNKSMGFSLFDHRSGPTADETRVLHNIDKLATFVRNTMVRCERIRLPLKLGSSNMSEEKLQMAADVMDLWVARPTSDEKRSRYCYTKLIGKESNAHEMFHTYFWTPDGKPIAHDAVEGFRNNQKAHEYMCTS